MSIALSLQRKSWPAVPIVEWHGSLRVETRQTPDSRLLPTNSSITWRQVCFIYGHALFVDIQLSDLQYQRHIKAYILWAPASIKYIQHFWAGLQLNHHWSGSLWLVESCQLCPEIGCRWLSYAVILTTFLLTTFCIKWAYLCLFVQKYLWAWHTWSEMAAVILDYRPGNVHNSGVTRWISFLKKHKLPNLSAPAATDVQTWAETIRVGVCWTPTNFPWKSMPEK